MDRHDIAALEARFGIAGEVKFIEGPNGLPVIEINNAQATAGFCLQGAQLLTWTPRAQAPVVWQSPRARFVPGKSVRGGVPVCWPWFGPHAREASFPAHGFARAAPWEVLEVQTLPDGATRLGFRLIRAEGDHTLWPHSARLELWMNVGEVLDIELVTANLEATPLTIGEALHTYFQVGDVREAAVRGLESCTFVDKVDGGRRKFQAGAVRFQGETDRVYLDTTADCCIDDPVLGRRIRIGVRGGCSTVVWNPWIEKAERMGDFEADGYLRMLCVESGNVASNEVSIAPGEEHHLDVRYSVEPLP